MLFTWGPPVLNPVNPGFSGGSGRAVASAANITDTFTNTMGAIGTATYTVTPFRSGCAGTPETVVVTVGSEPVLDPGLNDFACSNTAIGLLLKVSAGSVTPTYYNIISKTVYQQDLLNRGMRLFQMELLRLLIFQQINM